VEQDLFQLAHHGVRALKRGAVRQLGRDDVIALVLLRYEAARYPAEAETREEEKAGINDEHDRGTSRHAADETSIALRQAIEPPVERRRGAFDHVFRLGMLWLMRPQKNAAKRGREGERHEAGDHGRNRDGDGELAVKC